jgi:hypothetical protein
MKTSRSLCSALVPFAACALAGCASVPQGQAEAAAADIKVYKLGDLPSGSYEPVAHVWVDSWRTAFWAPTYATEDEAVSSLRTEAARLGANGLVNIVCLDQNTPAKSANAAPAILCYGYAIRVRNT